MRIYEVEANVKCNLENEIREYMENNFQDYGNFSILEKELGLSSDLLFATDREVEISTIKDTPKTDYVLIVEHSKFRGHYQKFYIYFFNNDEVDEVANYQNSFNADEIRYMEIEDDNLDTIEELNKGIFTSRDFV